MVNLRIDQGKMRLKEFGQDDQFVFAETNGGSAVGIPNGSKLGKPAMKVNTI